MLIPGKYKLKKEDTAMDEDIKIAFDQADIERQSQDEKLNLLLKIAFSNHSTLLAHSKLLFGNGKEGLCDSVRSNKFLLNLLMTVVGICIAGFATILYSHIITK
jgi:hypothetical protein